jgi:3-isopropylmalate/(R)-2-methylmalate dehydratase large subunit
MAAKTLFDKIWDRHVIDDLGGGYALLHVDRHIVHDLGGPRGFGAMGELGLPVRNPELTFAVPDHAVSSAPGRVDDTVDVSARLVPALRSGAVKAGVRLFDINDPEQGIVHVIGPEQGITLPGIILCCGDSHTSTHGGLGAVSFGIGTTELTHVLATQTIVQKRPRRMRITFNNRLSEGITAKDMILHLIGTLGTAAGDGFAIEYAGPAVRALAVDARLTLCNMTIEMGAKIGMIAPDEIVYEYLQGRPYAPQGATWDAALDHWRKLPSDDDAVFDREECIDAQEIEPQITWGTSPEHTIAVGAPVPDPDQAPGEGKRRQWAAALEYMALEPDRPLAGVPVDRVFIGSCTNGRLSDLRAAAAVARGRKVAANVTAWVVAGSQSVKRAAEAEGLDRIFTQAGFEWREPGCSMCVAANGETVAPGERCVSTSNRNFVGRQGPRSRTHLASPAMAAAAAVRGEITDFRKLGD